MSRKGGVQNAKHKRYRLFVQRAVVTENGIMAPCVFCDRLLPLQRCTLEHIIPRGRGGRDAFPNLVLSCHRCNHQRGVEDFGAFLVKRVLKQLGLHP